MEQHLRAAQVVGELEGLHAVLVMQHGVIIAEAYFPGEDESWGRPTGWRQHGPDTLHDIRSISKSLVGLLYGMALAEGLVPAPEAPLYPQFPEYPDLATDPTYAPILVSHALSMTTGIEWSEDRPYSDPLNAELAMERAEDRYRFVLERPVIRPPGEVWGYSGGVTALIARLIEKGSGQSLAEFAATRLFAPLGIEKWEWACGSDGVHAAASGLRLRARDLAKIGQLLLDKGRVDGRQILSEAWIAEMFTPRVSIGGSDFGYQWYLAPQFVAGLGLGGQRLSINRDTGIVMVVFAGLYNKPDAAKLAVKVSTEFLTPFLAQRAG